MPVPTPPQSMPWPFPAGQYVGDLNGPEESHGGYYQTETAFVQNVQQWLIWYRAVDGQAMETATWPGVTDGKFTSPKWTDAARRFHATNRPDQTTDLDRIYEDDYAFLIGWGETAPEPPAPLTVAPGVEELELAVESLNNAIELLKKETE